MVLARKKQSRKTQELETEMRPRSALVEPAHELLKKSRHEKTSDSLPPPLRKRTQEGWLE
jgi:hypothetical protein